VNRVLVIEEANAFVSVQDFGRRGTQRYGLPPSGAMDRLALARANALVGQPCDAPAIEIGPFPLVLHLEQGEIALALSGAARALDLAGQAMPCEQTLVLRGGQRLAIAPAQSGLFSYLACDGAVIGDRVFGSLSVNRNAGIGSPYPRPLMAGDRIAIAPRAAPPPLMRLDPEIDDGAIRIVPGPQHARFGDGFATFLNASWRLTSALDRMGYRLEGPPIHAETGHDIVTDGTVTGSIQIPGNGQPIVLMPDRGTSGGYPKIATIITPDIGRLAQTRPHQSVRFAVVGVAEAQALTRAYFEHIAAIPTRLRAVAGRGRLDLHAANLAGNAVSAEDSASWMEPGTEAPGDA